MILAHTAFSSSPALVHVRESTYRPSRTYTHARAHRYNAISGFTSSLEPAFATVTSNGDVFHSRPGTLEALCKFSGLVAFPFDQLVRAASRQLALANTLCASVPLWTLSSLRRVCGVCLTV